MKKLICLCLAAVLILMSGCQKTPDKAIVVQKDQESFLDKAQGGNKQNSSSQLFGGQNMIDMAPASTDNTALREMTGAPERVEYTEMALNGRLNVKVDAGVVLPNANAVPVLRVRAVDFPEELSIAFFNRLCSGEVLMDQSRRLTKSEIERKILENEQERKKPEYKDDPQAQAMYDQMNENLKKQYETAPDSITPMQNDGSFYSIPVIDPRQKVVGFYEGIEAFNDEKYFVIRNSNGLEKPVIYEYEGGGWSGVAAGSLATMYYDVYAYMQTSGVWGALPLRLIEDESVAPKEAYGQISCTPAEARAMAEDLLAGTGMGVYRIYLNCDYNPHFLAQETRTLENCNYGYTLECLRMVKGVPCASDSGVNYGVLDDYYSPSWPYEQLTIFITDDGIQSVQWTSPIEVTHILVENSNLMPFSDVMDIFKKMGPIVFTPNEMNSKIPYGDSEVAEYGFTVNEIRLELRRVREQNSVKDGLLVPVWSFYGNVWYSTKDGSETETPISDLNTCLLTINAVDGSIIDLSKGY